MGGLCLGYCLFAWGTWVRLPARSYASNTMTHHLLLLCIPTTPPCCRTRRNIPRVTPTLAVFPGPQTGHKHPSLPAPRDRGTHALPIPHDGSRDVGVSFASLSEQGCICGQAIRIHTPLARIPQRPTYQGTAPTFPRFVSSPSLCAVSLVHSDLLKRYGCVCPRAIVVPGCWYEDQADLRSSCPDVPVWAAG